MSSGQPTLGSISHHASAQGAGVGSRAANILPVLRPLSRRLSGAVTDLAYLLLAAFPALRRLYHPWAARRYAALAARYPRWAETDPTYLSALDAVLTELHMGPARVVEVGAGTGAATTVLAHRYPHAFIGAVDASMTMLSRLPAQNGRVRGIAGDAFRLPLHSGCADLVVVHNAPFDLRELARVAGPLGTVAVILSSAGGVPRPVRMWLLRRGGASGWADTREYAAGGGVGWIFQPGSGRSQPRIWTGFKNGARNWRWLEG